MRIRTTAAAFVTAAALFTTLTACGGDSDGGGAKETKADPAACKTAMAAAFDKTMTSEATGEEEQGLPEACDGIDDKTAEKLAREVTAEWMKSDKADQDVVVGDSVD
ncbi:hypothetical protein [uncultured Streptomyces sp.]|uniref:hypothetical protein n=1 Tax=uncultured Streptomyces sp. TaxID=174707 RepID=UPI00262CF4FF|nr:hypothetical protein [uncultured Streptomyces sp.]